MKKRLMSTIAKLGFGLVLLTAIIPAQAQSSAVSSVEKTAEVKYIGTLDDTILFDVSFDNPNAGKFNVIVLDQDGTVVFQGSYSEKKFAKRFDLPKSDKDKVTFVIRNFKDADYRQTFEINTHIKEDVVVTKL